MRAKEFIIIEQKQQLNELAPLAFLAPVIGVSLASMTLTKFLWYGVTGVLTGIELYNTLEQYQEISDMYGPNPLNWPEEQQEDLKLSIYASTIMALIGGAAPKLMSMAKNAFKKAPTEAKQEAMEKIAPKVEAEFKKMAKVKPSTAPATTPSTTPPAKTTSTITPVDPKQAELKRKLSGQPETSQERLKRELLAKRVVSEGILGDREYNRVMPVVKRIASEVSDYDRDEFGEELWSLLNQQYGSKFAQSVLQDSLSFYYDEYTIEVADQKGVAKGSDWGEPEELLSDVMSALERQVEWPLTDIMDRQEVQKLLQPVRDAVNAKMKNIAQGVAKSQTSRKTG